MASTDRGGRVHVATGRPADAAEHSCSLTFTIDDNFTTGPAQPVRRSLADVLSAFGAPVNQGCSTGRCGTCLVLVDGVPVRSCAALAVQHDGSRIDTARGSRSGLDCARDWMRSAGALQCGYCGPAFALTIEGLADAGPSAVAPGAVRTAISETLCRCSGYAALTEAARGVLSGEPAPDRTGRVEDERLLRGRGDFVAGRDLPGQLWARVVRSAYAHAGLRRVDAETAAALPGVAAVLLNTDLPQSLRFLHEDLGGPPEPLLAGTEVRYVGQPIALVLAETPEAAEDAADAVGIEYEPREALPGPEEPAPLPPPGDPRWTSRQTQFVAAAQPPVVLPDGAVELRRSFRIARQTGLPLEPRGLLARPDDDGLTVWGVTKHPQVNRERLAAGLGLDPDRIDLPSGDVGGAFGVKGELYPEDLLVPWSAVLLDRPVKWVEDRAEHLTAINHSRGQVWDVRIAADADGRLLDAQVRVVTDAGAYVRPLTSLVPYLSTAMFPGPYRMPNYRASAECLLTSRTPTGPVRAPGRYEANFVRERVLDMLAEQLGLDPAELRRRNLLTQADMPYDAGTVNEGPVHYDTGDFRAAFDRAVQAERADRRRQTTPRDDGLRRGSAVVPYVEKTGLGGGETAAATRLPDGSVRIDAASCPSGQSHETTLATIAGAVLGLPRDRITVVFGDYASGARGLGTFASRTIMHTGNAVHAACEALMALADPHAAGAGAVGRYDTEAHTYPYGAVTCRVAVDPELFTVRVEHLAISCDVGVPIDAAVVRGQLIGGLAQGVSGALFERLGYDPDGRPTAGGLDQYLVALAADLPDVGVELLDPAPDTGHSAPNAIRAKGVGEVGIAAAGAALAAAVANALPELNGRLTDLPLTPAVLWAASHDTDGPVAGRDDHERRT
ncbi:MAG TPA: molybdopterin cofactor-binding domain-containing protein [Actinocrinis sp.]|uniref:molybdopterin-dependent oxidoreductase n=1 Tax=Actinocrinis sp. TaxID=1920516 RepID=UPI002DDD59FD|nr:molybdopterin cofactor-binding domain-containing protein [Actinocrinis sp.]HEV2342910.1 molybdopterin cofactor-binding domain-containing protein [Actinocrinis sp.]